MQGSVVGGSEFKKFRVLTGVVPITEQPGKNGEVEKGDHRQPSLRMPNWE